MLLEYSSCSACSSACSFDISGSFDTAKISLFSGFSFFSNASILASSTNAATSSSGINGFSSACGLTRFSASGSVPCVMTLSGSASAKVLSVSVSSATASLFFSPNLTKISESGSLLTNFSVSSGSSSHLVP